MEALNLSHDDSPADIGNDVANVLHFLSDIMTLPKRGEDLVLTTDGITGLYVILDACIHTLRRIG